jgi:ATP-dependent helicase/nuclease subunit A
VKRDTLSRVILSQRVKREQTAEEMRVLYVAMTRAKRKLILTGCMSKPDEKLELAPSNPSAWQVLRCGNPAQWLLMGSRRVRQVFLHEREPYLSGSGEGRSMELPPYDPTVLAAIEAKLSWTYAHAEAIRLSAKAAVSKIGAPQDEPPEFRRPAFLGEKKSAVFAGTATHAAMQHLPLGRMMDKAKAADYLLALSREGKMSAEQAQAADASAVVWFTQQELYRRMSRAARLERELPFSYPADAQALYGVEADERVLLQGVVDACFLEDGGWTIVDYKTDRVRPGESALQAAKRHETQMRLYALAVEAITGQPVRERLVVLLTHRAVVAL